MNKRQILVAWEFNAVAWSKAIEEAHAEIGDDLWEYIGISKSRGQQWIRASKTAACEYPGMGNFLKVVDILQLDPTEFFILEEK